MSRQSCATRSGTIFDTTLTTPTAPTAAKLAVNESSPDRITMEHRRRISLAESIEPVASFNATIFGCFDNRSMVSGVMATAARPGMLYRTMGSSALSAIAIKC